MIGNGFLTENCDGIQILPDLTGRIDDRLEIDPEDPEGVRLREDPADPHYPAEDRVLKNILFGYDEEFVGTLEVAF